MSSLVSVISPCFNGEKFIERFLDSIIAQTYDNIECIMINDGSTDRTEEIMLSYTDRFKERGYNLIYIKQENAGQSAAINQGLKIVQGEYLTWLDSDDYLPIDAIEKKVNFFNSHPECGLLISKVQVVLEGSLKPIYIQERKINSNEKDLFFYDLIKGENVFYTPGGYMVRVSLFREAMPKPLQIEAPKEIGQNFQLILPISYRYPIGYLDEICYYYVCRDDSHSHVHHSYEDMEKIIDISDKMLKKVTDNITDDSIEKLKISNIIKFRKYKFKLYNMRNHNKKNELGTVIKEMNAQNIPCDKEMYIIIKCIQSPYYNYYIRLKSFLGKVLKRVISKIT